VTHSGFRVENVERGADQPEAGVALPAVAGAGGDCGAGGGVVGGPLDRADRRHGRVVV
jgi:hypothetical protein